MYFHIHFLICSLLFLVTLYKPMILEIGGYGPWSSYYKDGLGHRNHQVKDPIISGWLMVD
jgi:hypothetical protein